MNVTGFMFSPSWTGIHCGKDLNRGTEKASFSGGDWLSRAEVTFAEFAPISVLGV
jgi:hypothetical protein